MRHFAFALAVSLLIPGVWAQWSITSAAGPSGFVGAMHAENGMRVAPTGALAASLEASTPVTDWLHVTTRAGVGRMGLSAADRALERSEFSTASAGLRVQPLQSKTRRLNPWGAAGLAVVVQHNEMDLTNSMGQAYHFWSDGWIYDMPENHPEAADYARRISRDYDYESSTVRDYAVALPVQAGCDLQLTDALYGRVAYTVLRHPGPQRPLPGHAKRGHGVCRRLPDGCRRRRSGRLPRCRGVLACNRPSGPPRHCSYRQRMGNLARVAAFF
jgi:hypothetical protein